MAVPAHLITCCHMNFSWGNQALKRVINELPRVNRVLYLFYICNNIATFLPFTIVLHFHSTNRSPIVGNARITRIEEIRILYNSLSTEDTV